MRDRASWIMKAVWGKGDTLLCSMGIPSALYLLPFSLFLPILKSLKRVAGYVICITNHPFSPPTGGFGPVLRSTV